MTIEVYLITITTLVENNHTISGGMVAIVKSIWKGGGAHLVTIRTGVCKFDGLDGPLGRDGRNTPYLITPALAGTSVKSIALQIGLDSSNTCPYTTSARHLTSTLQQSLMSLGIGREKVELRTKRQAWRGHTVGRQTKMSACSAENPQQRPTCPSAWT
jgi:hypothetical protein